ncbi:sulfite exporter TauE/SafE family protein [Celeribacter sp.]|uniref:sulfite exporter TauE/SafE family protein n=1 Tax=Celeribacter sp. TaxID=1890673 RepID=UPI003A924C94
MLDALFHSPFELMISVLAVFLVGLAKGGLGALSLLGVPLMALFMPPVTAAAILLPVLIVMDGVSLMSWRGWFDRVTLKLVLPGAVLGIGIGWATAEIVSDAAVRLIVGLVAGAFVCRAMFARLWGKRIVVGHRPWLGRILGTVAGYTSFVAHAGGPPLQLYLMPMRIDPKLYTGTTVLFFAVTNVMKLIPYFALGQLGLANLTLSAALVPVAVVATWIGARIVRRMRPEIFYPFTYASIALVAVKLCWDGLVGLM